MSINPTNIAQSNATGASTPNQLLYDQVMEETLMRQFKSNLVFSDDKFLNDTLNGSPSKRFPSTLGLAAGYYTPGSPMTGQAIVSGHRDISIDALLKCDVWLYDLDLALSKLDWAETIGEEMAYAMVEYKDNLRARMLTIASRTPRTINDSNDNGGTEIVNPGFAINPSAFIAGLYDVKAAASAKKVYGPLDCVTKSGTYYKLQASGHITFSRDYNPTTNLANDAVPMVADIRINHTNAFPNANYTNVTGQVNSYAVDTRNLEALFWNKRAMGVLKLAGMEMSMRQQRFENYASEFKVAREAEGMGVLRPQAAFALVTSKIALP